MTTTTTAKTIVQIPYNTGDRRYKMWAKHITKINTEASNGYAFEGTWLTLGRKAELPIGSYVLLYGEEGSRAHRAPVVRIARVEADSTLVDVLTATDPSWALDLRDEAAALLAPATPDRAALEAEAAALRARLAEIETILQEA